MLAGVLAASSAEAGGFQFRAALDAGAAARLGQVTCIGGFGGSCGAYGTLRVGPLAALDLTAGWRFGRVALHGGGELQWTWYPNLTHVLRAGPLLGVSVYAARWAVLSLDAKLLFTAFGVDLGGVGGTFRWGFQLTPDGRHQLAASLGFYWVGGLMWTGALSYVFTLQP